MNWKKEKLKKNKRTIGEGKKLKKLLLLFFLITSLLTAQDLKIEEEKPWAIGMAVRSASIPFRTDTSSVSTLVPLFFYEGEYFYLRGIEGGLKFYKTKNWQFTALGRLRFFDFPEQYQNAIQGDQMEWGLQAKYKFAQHFYSDIELLTDWEGHISSNIRAGYDTDWHGFRFDSFLELKIKTSQYNSYYYGLTQTSIGAGTDIGLGIIADYHVLSNLYFFGAAKLSYFDKNVRNSEFIRDKFHGQLFVGFGFSNDKTKPRKKKLESKPYIKLAMGFATPSDLSNIIRFQAVRDTNNNKMTSIFYGHPLTDRLFSLPIHIYLTPGFVYHWPSDVQTNSQEVVIAVKFYYTIQLPVKIKLGFGEGISYIGKPTYVEANELYNKGYVPSNTMNYLDFSVDLNFGGLFESDIMDRLWIGYYIHHRSSIFEMAQQFGRIKGGSNYQSFYLQWDL